MKCENCNNEIQDGYTTCPACEAEAPQTVTGNIETRQPEETPYTTANTTSGHPQVVVVNQMPAAAQYLMAKSRLAYILLAFFLGPLGIHNFYAKRTGYGVAQLLMTLCSCGILSLASFIWSIVEMIVVDKDANGVPFR